MKHKRNVSKYFMMELCLIIVLVVVLILSGLELIGLSDWFGFFCCGFAVLALILGIAYYEYVDIMVRARIQNAGMEQNESQFKLFMEMPVPYVMTDSQGNIIWFNRSFFDMVGDKANKKNISQIFAGLHKKVYPALGLKKKVQIPFEDRDYRVEISSLSKDNEEIPEGNSEGFLSEYDDILTFYFFDVTAVNHYQEEAQRKSLVSGLIYIDNYEEVLENMEEVRQSLLLALVERKIVKYVQGFGGIIKRFEKDKFFFVFEKINYEKMVDTRFSILDDVRSINIGNDLSVTLSIGVGVNAPNYAQAYDNARIAMDMALGRGGDQAVVRDGDSLSYYGGKTQKVEKSTRVKARVKAHALREIMLNHDNIFIMGHKFPDADSIGAALGIYRLCRTFEKTAYIVMDKTFPAIEPIVTEVEASLPEGEKDIFISGEQALVLKNNNSAIIVVDVNVPGRTECPDLLKYIKTIVVLDHHRVGNEVIKNSTVSYVEPYASSACEMVAEILQYIAEKPKLKPIEADALYSGILVDTNNFVAKAGVRTFEAAAYLRRMGTDVTRVRKMFREDMEHNRLRAEVVSHAEVYNDIFAISAWDSRGISGASIVGAKAANELLNVQGIRASFVFTKIDDEIFVSARSIDDVNVQVIMEKLGGGGHLTVAATQIKDRNLKDSVEWLKEVLLEMEQEGDL